MDSVNESSVKWRLVPIPSERSGLYSPPIAAVFLLEFFGIESIQEAHWQHWLVDFQGMFRFRPEINKANLSGFLYDFADLNFLYFAIFHF